MNDDLDALFELIDEDREGYVAEVTLIEAVKEHKRLLAGIREIGVEKYHFTFKPGTTDLQRLQTMNHIFKMWINGETFKEREFPPGF